VLDGLIIGVATIALCLYVCTNVINRTEQVSHCISAGLVQGPPSASPTHRSQQPPPAHKEACNSTCYAHCTRIYVNNQSRYSDITIPMGRALLLVPLLALWNSTSTTSPSSSVPSLWSPSSPSTQPSNAVSYPLHVNGKIASADIATCGMLLQALSMPPANGDKKSVTVVSRWAGVTRRYREH